MNRKELKRNVNNIIEMDDYDKKLQLINVYCNVLRSIKIEEDKRNMTKGLWNILSSLTKEQCEDFLNNVDYSIIKLLRSYNNPVNKPIVQQGNEEKKLVFYYVNLGEKYYYRECMTTIVGFIYRMLSEIDMPKQPFLSEDSKEYSDKFYNMANDYVYDKTHAYLNNLISKYNEYDFDYYRLNTYLIQYRMGYWNAKLARISNEVKELELNMERTKEDIETAKKLMDYARKKRELIIQYREKHPFNGENPERPENYNPYPYLNNMNKIKLTNFDYLRPTENFDHEVEARDKEYEMLQNKLIDYEVEYEPLKKDYERFEEELNKCRKKNTSLRDKYVATFDGVKRSDLNQYVDFEYELKNEDFEIIHQMVKDKLGIEKTQEDVWSEQKEIIQYFLDQIFVYNPDKHVQAKFAPYYERNYKDALRQLSEEYAEGDYTKEEYNEKISEVHRRVEEKRKAYSDKVEYNLIPPIETFKRIERYRNDNYEAIKQATVDIYHERPEIDTMICPLAVVNSEVEYEEYKKKYMDEFESDVYLAKFCVWNLLASWEDNRSKINFYNKKTEIIEKIIEQNKLDQKIGEELTKKRGQLAKGKSSDEINEYLENNPGIESEYGIPRASDNIQFNFDDPKLNETEVGVNKVIPRRFGYRNKFFIQKGKFNIEADNGLPEGKIMDSITYKKQQQ